MNNFNYLYPVRQHFGKRCAEGTIKEEMKPVKRVLQAACCKLMSRDEKYELLEKCK